MNDDYMLTVKQMESEQMHLALEMMMNYGVMSERTAMKYHKKLNEVERWWVLYEKGVPFASQQHQRQAD